MVEFWNNRYSSREFVYGKEPNAFFRQELSKLDPGRILLPADGEGRNGVFAATRGWEVFAFDASSVAREKALKLAAERKVAIIYAVSTFEDFEWHGVDFDCLALIYAHMPGNMRKEYHRKFLKMLRKGGTVILEAFNKEQLGKATGGPQELDMLFSKEDLHRDFKKCSEIHIEELNTTLNEGKHHSGEASIVRLIAVK